MRFKLRNALLGISLYVYILIIIASIDESLSVIFVIYTAACMAVNKSLIAGAESRKNNNAIEFSQTDATDSIGVQYGSFHHVFYSNEAVTEAYRQALNNALKGKLGCPDFYEVAFKDVDRDLNTPETRTFLLTTAAETVRKSGFSLLCNFTRTANIQSVRWWMLVNGVLDPNKIFWRYVFSPLFAPLSVLPYLQRQYDPLNGLMTIYPGFFNGIDVLNRTREIQFVAFETLVEVLDSFGIDTTDLKQQKGNILNINVSGGKTNFGSVVQGAMNKVAGVAGGQKS
jgi:hypothetical protein